MKAIVIGGSGQIGGWLLRHLAERGHETVGTYATVAYPGLVALNAADRDTAADWVRSQRPEVVFYPAGFTWVDGCERDPDKARASNRDEPLNLALAAAESDARFVYFSTDYVFNGTTGPDAEDSPTHPPNIYGLAKLEAEAALTEALGDRVLIARTSWVYGPERQGKNFAYQVVRNLKASNAMPTPSDMASSPSYAPDVALATLQLAEQGKSGVWHVAGPEVVARSEFARGIALAFGLDPALIQPRPTSEIVQGAPRPLQGGLKIEKLEAQLPGLMRPMASALEDFLARLDAHQSWADPRSEV
ncbi:dTDP-4-dehydrorhamnose reductase [soil metagenome]